MNELQLPDAELEVMACLWEAGPATVRQIREALHSQRPMTHASAFTLLKRLEQKGFVARERGPVGKAFVYRPVAKSGGTYRQVLGDLLDRVFRGSGISLFASLLETRPPTDSEIDELEKLLADLRQKRTGTTRKPQSATPKHRKRS